MAVVLAVNLLPVALLRMTMGAGTVYPKPGGDGLFSGSAQVFRLGVPGGECGYGVLGVTGVDVLGFAGGRTGALVGLLVVAGVATFSPVLVRGMRKR